MVEWYQCSLTELSGTNSNFGKFFLVSLGEQVRSFDGARISTDYSKVDIRDIKR